MISSTSSVPLEMRIMSSVTPQDTRSSTVIDICVVDHGCPTIVFESPTLFVISTRRLIPVVLTYFEELTINLKLSMSRNAAFWPPTKPKVKTEQKPFVR